MIIFWNEGIPGLATRSGTFLGFSHEIGPDTRLVPRDHEVSYLDLMNSWRDLGLQKQPPCR